MVQVTLSCREMKKNQSQGTCGALYFAFHSGQRAYYVQTHDMVALYTFSYIAQGKDGWHLPTKGFHPLTAAFDHNGNDN